VAAVAADGRCDDQALRSAGARFLVTDGEHCR
jgi:hypothetical protein